MEPRNEPIAPLAETNEPSWLKARKEVEDQWKVAISGETPDLVPSKLPISQMPVRHIV